MSCSTVKTTTFGSDAATRALSVTAVENDFVARVYEKLAICLRLHLRPHAASWPARGDPTHGHQAGDRVLEVGVGTGINAVALSARLRGHRHRPVDSMLEKARERVAREGLRNVRLLEMDAAHLIFADDTFDIVYAPYLVSVVPDPVEVVSEMRRVCRPGGKIIILNHFRSAQPAALVRSSARSRRSPCTSASSRTSICPAFLAQADLQPVSIEKVNFPQDLVARYLQEGLETRASGVHLPPPEPTGVSSRHENALCPCLPDVSW